MLELLKATLFNISHLIIFISFSTAYGQSQPTHEKKVYQSEDGKTYWNKHLPTYLKLSSSPDGTSPDYVINSDTSAKYTNPLYFDSEGINYIRTKWAVDKSTQKTVEPKKEVMWEIFVDGLAPSSTFHLKSEKIVVANEKKYCDNNAEVTLAAKDATSGVDKTFYSLNNDEFKEYSSSIKLTEQKEYTIKYYSVDKVGNVEAIKTESFVVDGTAPQTELTITGNFNENVLSGQAKVTLHGTDDLSGVGNIFYSIGDNKEKVYTGPLDVSGFLEGEYKLKYYSIDKVKNTEATKEFTFFIDKTAPKLQVEIVGASFTINGKTFFSGTSQLQLTSTDNKAGVKGTFYSINGSAFQPYTEPFNLEMSGKNLINYYTIDLVGNKSSVKEEFNYKAIDTYVDMKGPVLSHKFLGTIFKTRDTVFIAPGTKIQLDGVDAESGLNEILYSINDKESTKYEKPFSIEKGGIYKVKISGYDNVINSSTDSVYFVVDDSGPEIIPTFDGGTLLTKTINGASSQVYPSYISLFLSATDSQLGYDKIYFSVNGGPETLYTKPLQGFGKEKDYIIKVRALDKLGNSSTQELSFAIGN